MAVEAEAEMGAERVTIDAAAPDKRFDGQDLPLT